MRYNTIIRTMMLAALLLAAGSPTFAQITNSVSVPTNIAIAGTCSAGQLVIANTTTGPTCAAYSTAYCVYGSATGACSCTAGSCTYTPPTGAAFLDMFLSGSGGGGGGAQTGGAAAHSGGGGVGGTTSEWLISGVIESSYTITLGAGGALGACNSGASNAGGVPVTTTLTSGNWTNTITTQASAGTAAQPATTTTDGAAGTISTIGGSTFLAGWNGATVTRLASSVGGAGTAGNGATVGKGSYGGAAGGSGASVTSGGACNVAATNGANGFAVITARAAF